MTVSGKLNILLGVHQFFPRHTGGTEVLTLELARGLRLRGHYVQIVAGEPEQDLPETAAPWLGCDQYDGFVVHRLHYGIANIKNNLSLDLNASERVRLVKELVVNLKPDIVHLNHIMGLSAPIIPVIRQMGIPVILTPTDFWIVCPNITLFRYDNKTVCEGPEDGSVCSRCQPVSELDSPKRRLKMMVDSVNFANKVLPATKFLADILIGNGIMPELVSVVPYGIDIGHLPDKIQIPQQFTKSTPLQIGYIGTLTEIKGPHVILGALDFMHDEKQKLVINIYGRMDKEDPYIQLLRQQAENLDARIIFKGTFPHNTIGEILRRQHLLIVPSIWYESTPLVLCSALAAGTPVLVSRLGGMTEPLIEGVNGFSFPAEGSYDLSKLICQILYNPKILAKMQEQLKPRNRCTMDYVIDIETEYLKTIF